MKKSMNKVAALGLALASVVALSAPAHAEVKLPNGLSFGSQIFGSYTNVSVSNPGGAANIGTQNTALDTANDFAITRAYLYLIDKIDDNISARITLDAQTVPAAAPNLFLKHAYMDYKLNDSVTVEAGLGSTPWVGFIEKLWGYRSIADRNNNVAGKVLTDRIGALSSADGGVSVMGTAGGFNYQLGAFNGEGYGTAANGAGLKFAGRLGYDFDGGLGIAAYYDAETKRNGTVGYDPTRTAVTVYFKQPTYTIAGEYLLANDFAGLGAAPGTAKFADANGFSVFGNVLVTDAVRLFARYDSMTNNTRTGSVAANLNVTETVLTAGATYILAKGQEVSIDYSVATNPINGTAVLNPATINGSTVNTIAVNLLTGF